MSPHRLSLVGLQARETDLNCLPSFFQACGPIGWILVFAQPIPNTADGLMRRLLLTANGVCWGRSFSTPVAPDRVNHAVFRDAVKPRNKATSLGLLVGT